MGYIDLSKKSDKERAKILLAVCKDREMKKATKTISIDEHTRIVVDANCTQKEIDEKINKYQKGVSIS